MEFDRLEALRIGQELKRIRKQKGLSLADVEAISGGAWKAVVIGSYERADRAITIGRLSSLMALYQAPIASLFPNQNGSSQSERPLTFDLAQRANLRALHPGLDRILSHVINQRGDWNGHILTLRQHDLLIFAIAEALPYHEFLEKLTMKKFLLQLR